MDDKILKQRTEKVKKMLTVLKQLYPKPKTDLHYSTPWELMVAVQLSAQCTDRKVNEVTAKLFKKYRTLGDYVKAKPREFEEDIYQTGFYRNKTRNILAAARMVREHFDGRIPRTMADILTIPGVARKTANVVLGNAYGVVAGIAVDTHVRRLARRLRLTDHDDPVKIERDLMQILPKKEWRTFTYRLIEYGRKYCQAKRHNHSGCPLASLE